MNYTYILRCADGTFYTGWTNDIKKRLAAHNGGKGGKYTRVRLPVTLIYVEEHETKQAAQKREYAIKQLTRLEKETLVSGPSNVLDKISFPQITHSLQDVH